MSANKLSYLLESSGLDWKNLIIAPDSGTKLSHEFPLMPDDFLEFGNRDVQSKSVHGYVNAISNSKRAMDCQVERIVTSLGFSPSQLKAQIGKDLVQQIEKRSVPSALPFIYRFLESLGGFTPSLVDRVRLLRHDVEHRFLRPTRRKAIEALEIATLFVRATESVIANIFDSFGFGSDYDDRNPRGLERVFRIHMDYQSTEPHGEVRYYSENFKPGDPSQNAKILPIHPTYYWCVRLGIVLSRDENPQSIVRELVVSTGSKISRGTNHRVGLLIFHLLALNSRQL